MTKPITTACPECSCPDTADYFKDAMGDGYRICQECNQEWWVNIDYKKKDM